MPIGIALLANNKTLNWAFETEAQEHLKGRRLFWPRGKTLGGSSSINAMVYIRGHKADYEHWGQEAGTDRWGWDRALELFRRVEDNTRFGPDSYHNKGGELTVSDLKSVNPLSQDFVRAAPHVELSVNADFNGGTQEGLGLYQVTQQNGRRWSSAQAFLRGAENRPNLDILTDARVTRVVMDGKRAVGVTLKRGGEYQQLRLNDGGEVILSGGAVNSPQLLMLSGIGDKDEIGKHGIPLVHHLPEVGKNLVDHLDITLMHAANSRLPIGVAPSFLLRGVSAFFSYIFARRGFLTSNVAESGGFVKSEPSRERPNVQFHFLPTYLKDHGRKIMTGYGYTLHICDLLPKSRGFIGLKSPDPLADPLIQPNYLNDPEDVKTMVSAVKFGRRILGAPTMALHSKQEVMPGKSVSSDSQIADFIRANAETIYHPVGTCRMGADQNSVVDPELKVRGVEGLRVVDASIMPSLVAGNTNAPTMMIAENAADMLLGKI
jgi:choline dehydrogenase-like flavoprotein